MPRWVEAEWVAEEERGLVQVIHTAPSIGDHVADRNGHCWCEPHKEILCWPPDRDYVKSVLYIHLYEGEPRYGNQQSRPG